METLHHYHQQEFSLLSFSPVIDRSGFDIGFCHEFDTTFSFPIDYHLAIPPPPLQFSGEGAAAELEKVKRKMSHNESERMRRMKLKSLFASLSSVLPHADKLKKKKVGAPTTLDRVIEYIPQLRKEVEKLVQRKQRLEPATRKNNVVSSQAATTWTGGINSASSFSDTSSSSWSVQVNEIGNGEISIQISTSRFLVNTFIPISEVLRMLEEEEGLITIEVSSSDSSDGRVFYHVHLMAEDPDRTQKMECELLRKKLLCSCQKWEEMCLWMIIQDI